MDIKRLVKSCEFKEQEDEMLRDKIVMGTWDNAVQTKLLSTTDLTYEKAVDRCRASEISREQAKSLNKEISMNELNSKNAYKKNENGKERNNNNNTYEYKQKEKMAYSKYDNEQERENDNKVT